MQLSDLEQVVEFVREMKEEETGEKVSSNPGGSVKLLAVKLLLVPGQELEAKSSLNVCFPDTNCKSLALK